ncbi:MAG: enoyl-CoA hydratase [Ilumatobacter sp.]|nr:enoyl-CoA hydratase [Ilumatobacter sp.]
MTVRVDEHGSVVVVTLDRPERRNAVDHATLRELLAVQADLAGRTPHDVRAVVLTGAPPAFSAGADLHGVERGEFAEDLHTVLAGFGTLPVPVIAAVDGPALGAGTQLVIAADLRVATPGSLFGIPAARLGICVDHWTIRRLTNEFTLPVAKGMLVGCENYDAERLHDVGAIHRLGDLEDAMAWAERLAALAPLTIATHKLGIELAEPEGDTVREFDEALERTWASADAAEGRAAFLAKRAPNFTGD